IGPVKSDRQFTTQNKFPNSTDSPLFSVTDSGRSAAFTVRMAMPRLKIAGNTLKPICTANSDPAQEI
ncbi:MAG TPA: hypothetical protein VFC11_07210, partial [Methylocella sp.]|nr:hypothetical protein [Methylocella sp.]